MKTGITLALIIAVLGTVTATPDCYDFSVTEISDSYFELLPKMLFYGNVDWMKLNGGKNCGFYTYGDVFVRSYDKSTSAIYFTFMKTMGTTCELDPKLNTLTNNTWLYANSLNADSSVCGYYVGIANSGSVSQMIQIVRSTALYVSVGMAAVLLGTTLFY
jgi:hypothetical protein